MGIVEVNQTFYQVPDLKLAHKWRSEAPADFEFTVKAWQLITHPYGGPTYRKLKEKVPEKSRKCYGMFRQTNEVFEAWQKTLLFGQLLKTKVYLFQTPPAFYPHIDNITNMTKFFSGIAPTVQRLGLTLCWEPRGKWPADLIIKLCSQLNLVHCVDPLKNKPLHGHVRYFRLHGPYNGEKISYDYDFNDGNMKSILPFLDKPINYVFFNNVSMWQNAIDFKKML